MAEEEYDVPDDFEEYEEDFEPEDDNGPAAAAAADINKAHVCAVSEPLSKESQLVRARVITTGRMMP